MRFGSSGLAGLLRFAVAGLRLERSADPGNDPLGEAGLSCAPLEPGHGGGLDVHAQHLPPGPTIRAKGRLKKKGLRGAWVEDLDLHGAPALVQRLARDGLWLEQEPIAVDPRTPAALEAML